MKNLFTDLVKATDRAFNKYYNGKLALNLVSDEIDAILQKKYTKNGQVLYLHCIWKDDDDYAVLERTTDDLIVLAEVLER